MSIIHKYEYFNIVVDGVKFVIETNGRENFIRRVGEVLDELPALLFKEVESGEIVELGLNSPLYKECVKELNEYLSIYRKALVKYKTLTLFL